MCSFIILLLLLCKNNCGSNCGTGCVTNYNTCYRDKSDYYSDKRDEHCDKRDDHWREKDKDCGCSACEECACKEESPIVEREDIWTSYKNTSSGKNCK